MIDITVRKFVRNNGSLWLFEGVDQYDNLVRFWAKPEVGAEMIVELDKADEPVIAEAEDWLVVPVSTSAQ